jgi:uncharacterized cupredoxin-like copper-binding protein
MPRLIVPAVGAVVGALAIGACGSSSSGGTTQHAAAVPPSSSTSAPAPAAGSGSTSSSSAPTTSTASSAAAPASMTVSVMAMSSGALMFNTTSLTAKAGKVTVHFTNMAPEGHDLSIQQGTNGPVLAQTGVFQGATKTLTVSLKPGTYTYFCNVPGHRQAGMQGTLKVVA